jgi:hypothetical protein
VLPAGVGIAASACAIEQPCDRADGVDQILAAALTDRGHVCQVEMPERRRHVAHLHGLGYRLG